ncbi:MAG: SurA N-terminal domain-containing protein [Bacteroidaceae bacterium]|nr:SurA N-terminal domain-containing protein [Bacteroidaceae bacterium]
MATLQSIRKHGAALVITIGIALFAFIAGDAAKVLQPSQNSQTVGKVNGTKIDVQEFQKQVEEYTQAVNFARGTNSLTEEENAQIKDEVWNTLVTNALIGEEAAKLGLTVSTAELQAVINEGTNPMLAQSPFVSETTGKFDRDILMKFLADYANLDPEVMPAEYIEYYHQLYNYWKFLENNLISSILMGKYETLVTEAQLSNPVAAEYAFNARNAYAEVAYAAVPYSSVADSLVKVSNSDIKKLYEEKKELYKMPVETRSIKYIDFTVKPSEADRQELLAEVGEYAQQLATTEDLGALVRLANSEVAFSEVPVTSKALPEDVVANLGAVSGDAVYGPYYNQADDSYNAFRILSKQQLPDSVQFRQIQVADADAARAEELADSIYKAIRSNNNRNFAEIAEKYGQASEPAWISTANFEGAAISGDNATYLNTLFGMRRGELKHLTIGGGHLIIEVLDTKNPVEKYTAAIIKRPAYFSNETYAAAYNQLSTFVASNQSLEDFEANAEEAGYRLYPVNELSNAAHNIGGVQGTREALRWAFNAEKGEISHIFEAGANDHLMVVAVADIHKAGYRPAEQFADILRIQALNDKKADKIMADAKKVKSMDEALALANVKSDTLRRVTFSSAAYVSKVPASENAISGVASGLEEGAFFGPIKGNGAVYFVQVSKKGNGVAKFDAATEQKNLEVSSTRFINGQTILNELFRKGNVEDNRYLFF